MKKLTFTEIKKNLQKNYIDGLAFFSNYFAQFNESEVEDKIYEFDERVWNSVEKWGLTEQYLQIYSALLMSV